MSDHHDHLPISYRQDRAFPKADVPSLAGIREKSPEISPGFADARSVFQSLQRCRNPPAPVDEHRIRSLIHRHYRPFSQQTAEIQRLADGFANGGNQAHGCGLGVEIGRASCRERV